LMYVPASSKHGTMEEIIREGYRKTHRTKWVWLDENSKVAADAVKLGAENKLSDAYDESGVGIDDDGVVFKDPKVEDNIQAHYYLNFRNRLHKVVPKVQRKFNGPIKVCILPFAFAIQQLEG
ncbi:hypothetical protein M8C21_002673, partial [Ambrosia artemisiifolia]